MDRLKLLDAGLRAFDARLPDVAPALCVVTRYRASSCRRCLEVCPTDAIAASPWLRVEPERCSSCGACAAACPTGALGFATRAAGLRERCGAAAGGGGRSITLACRYAAPDARGSAAVEDDAVTVVLPCLGSLCAADLIGAAAAGVGSASLLCGSCETCPDRSAGLGVKAVVEVARATLAALDCAFTVVRREIPGDASVPAPTPAGLSRRDLFSFLARGARRTAAEGLGSAQRTVRDLHAQAEPPAAHRHLLADIDKLARGAKGRPAVLPAALPLGTLVVDERCNGCALCTRYCPHQALVVRDGGLFFDRSLCTGCGLCAEVCPFTALVAGPQTAPVRSSAVDPRSSSATRLWPTS